MALFDTPLGTLLGAAPGKISPEGEAFVARIATMAVNIVEVSSSAAVIQALSAPTPESFMGAFADLMTANSSPAPGTQARLRGGIALLSILAENGGLWRAAEAQEQLGVSRTALQQWREAKRVIALPLADNSFGYPVAQFARPATDADRPRPFPGIPDVLEAAGEALSAAELISLLAVSQPYFDGRSGFELLPFDAARVIALVRHVATPADADAPLVAQVVTQAAG